jgi:hypothetical protein
MWNRAMLWLSLGRVIYAQDRGPAQEASMPPNLDLRYGFVARVFVSVVIATIASLPAIAQAHSRLAQEMIVEITLLASPNAPPADNLLVNGSFEDPPIPAPSGFRTFGRQGMPGWQILSGTVDVVNARYWPPAPDGGSQSLDLTGSPGAATIQQSLPTEPGRYYLFSGWTAHNPQNPVSVEGRINVSLNGQMFTQLFHSDPLATLDDLHWTPFAYWFRATESTTTLTLSDVTRSEGSSGSLLDGLAVTAGPILMLPLTPAPPTGLQAKSASSTSAKLKWISNSHNETGFQVWRKEASGEWAQIALTPPKTTTYTDDSVQPHTSYTYRVRAVNNIYPSVWSPEAGVTTP